MKDSKAQQALDAKNKERLEQEYRQKAIDKSRQTQDLKIKAARFFGGSSEGREMFTLLSLYYQSQQIADPEKTHAHACFNQGKLQPFKDIAKWIEQLQQGQFK